MTKKKKYVIGNTDSAMLNVYTGRICEVVKDYLYNDETWYKLRDMNTKQIFDSPTVFWNDYNI